MKAKYPFYFLIGNMIYKRYYFFYKPLYFLYKRISDRKKISNLKKLIKPGMTVLDVGANIGFYSILFSKLVGKNGKVYAYEPEAENFLHLKKNCKDLLNLSINNVAVSDKSGKIKLYYSDDLNVDHNTYDNGENRKCIEINSVSLDDCFKNNEIIDFIKVDIQGYDYYALIGGKNLISRSSQLVILSEFWPYGLSNAGVKPSFYIDFLEKMNFQIDLTKEELKNVDRKVGDNLFSLDIIARK
jgi:FkbM family methyltransferase